MLWREAKRRGVEAESLNALIWGGASEIGMNEMLSQILGISYSWVFLIAILIAIRVDDPSCKFVLLIRRTCILNGLFVGPYRAHHLHNAAHL